MSQTTPKRPDPLAAHKAQAKQLRAMLAADGITVTYSEALERVARLHGSRDWNTLSAQICTPQQTSGAYGTEIGAQQVDVGAYGTEIGSFEIEDWQDISFRKADVAASITFGISVGTSGININAPQGEDYRGVKIEVQNNEIRILAYDERVGESPAILIISADGKRPIRADLHDHFIGANYRMISPMDDAQPNIYNY